MLRLLMGRKECMEKVELLCHPETLTKRNRLNVKTIESAGGRVRLRNAARRTSLFFYRERWKAKGQLSTARVKKFPEEGISFLRRPTTTHVQGGNENVSGVLIVPSTCQTQLPGRKRIVEIGKTKVSVRKLE